MDNMRDNHFGAMPISLTSSLAEWGQTSFVLDAYKKGINTVVKEVYWRLPVGSDLNDFLMKLPDDIRYNSINEKYSLLMFDWGFGYVTTQNMKMIGNFTGPSDAIDKFIAWIDTQYPRMATESTIEWYYQKGQNVGSISVNLNYKKAFDSFYPYLQIPGVAGRAKLTDYFTDYMKSDSSVLILIGPPGTGKTSFIKNMLHDTKSSAIVTYDKNILAADQVFVNFVSDDSVNFLVAEDADNFLGERKEGNDFMFKFLSISDGLVSAANKKIVFSTNLENTSHIDPALLRKGRCYDVVHFRPLSRAETEMACKDIGKELTLDGTQFTLTEVFNGKEKPAERKMGF